LAAAAKPDVYFLRMEKAFVVEYPISKGGDKNHFL